MADATVDGANVVFENLEWEPCRVELRAAWLVAEEARREVARREVYIQHWDLVLWPAH